MPVPQKRGHSSIDSPNPVFTGKVIAITGGARGIGFATARYLIERGATVALADILSDKVEQAVKFLEKAFPGSEITSSEVDVRDAMAVEEWLLSVKDMHGKIDGCLNGAGIIGNSTQLSEMSVDEWDSVIGVNLTGVFNCVRTQLNLIQDGGSIVNIASVGGKIAWEGGGAYCASKHGVIGLTKAAAKEVASRGVRVNAVCPAFTDTQMIVNAKQSLGQDFGPENSPQILKRFAQPHEIAAAIAYLLGDESKFVTGSSLMVDGGWTA